MRTGKVFKLMKKEACKSHNHKKVPIHIYAELSEIYKSIGEYNYLKVEGVSMSPAIKCGDRVVIEYRPNMLKVGDIIIFRDKENKKLIAHRIISLTKNESENKIIARGDNNIYPDPPLSKKDIIGKVVEKYNYEIDLEEESIFLLKMCVRIKTSWRLFFAKFRSTAKFSKNHRPKHKVDSV